MARSSEDTPQKACRQAQGLACNECRARKLRCDRIRPTCGTCEGLGVDCTPNTSRQPRGPRRGHLKALQSRILALERQIGNSGEVTPPPSNQSFRSEQSPPPQEEDGTSDDRYEEQVGEEETSERQPQQPPESHISAEQIPTERNPLLEVDDGLSTLRNVQTGPYDFSNTSSSTANILEQIGTTHLLPDMASFTPITTEFEAGARMIPKTTSSGGFPSGVQTELPHRVGLAPEFHISGLMKADLSHLYFDRVHLFAPILNRRRYFNRATQAINASAPFSVLQHAMWTLAAWFGSQFTEIQGSLYTYTRSLLEEWEPHIATESPPIELAQAWILLTMYETMQVNYERGWLSAGRCFRLVQLMKLHEIDKPTNPMEPTLPYVECEERRRTFWMAYALDRFINLVNQMPLTLDEQVILTRLPAPEADFQRERPSKTRFLSEVMAGEGNDDAYPVSPFNVCIVLVTISGRCLAHQQQCVVERAYGHTPHDFLTRHQWLESLLTANIKAMLNGCPGDPDHEPTDPLLLFTSMVAQATILLLGKSMQSAPWNCQDFTGVSEQRIVEAAQKVSHLSQRLAEFGYFKIHPFTPIPLFFCAEFAQGRRQHDPAFQALFDFMASSLRDLGPVNLLSETCLAKINALDAEMDGITAK